MWYEVHIEPQFRSSDRLKMPDILGKLGRTVVVIDAQMDLERISGKLSTTNSRMRLRLSTILKKSYFQLSHCLREASGVRTKQTV